MQQILIGNPLVMTGKGLLELHKLKYNNTYCYKREKKGSREPDHYTLISEEEFLRTADSFAHALFLLPVEISNLQWSNTRPRMFQYQHSMSEQEFYDKLETSSYADAMDTHPAELMWFTSDWYAPSEDLRSDADLVELFHSDSHREYFEYNDKPRIIIIPDDIDWYLGETDMMHEYIQEKARSWS